MREAFIGELVREVLGPRDGAEEILCEEPYDEYLTGILIPKNWSEKYLEENDTELGIDSGNAEDDSSDIEMLSNIAPALDPRSKPRSIGISFRLKGTDPSFRLCLTWGRYRLQDGKWKRNPNYKIIDVKLLDIAGTDYKKYPIYLQGDGEIDLTIKKSIQEEQIPVTVNLINNLNPVGEHRPDTSCCVFQPSIRIQLHKGTYLVSEKSPKPINSEEETLNFLYRERPSLARGHMCASFWHKVDPEQNAKISNIDFSSFWVDGAFFQECKGFIAPDVRSEFVPLYAIPSPDFSWKPEFEVSPILSPKELSEMWLDEEINRYLLPIYNAYNSWIKENEAKLVTFSGNELDEAQRIIIAQKIACERIRSGIDLIKSDPNIRLSFCFANRVIWLQNHWRGNDGFKWYPFQLAFFLLNIDPLFEEKSKNRGIADLLWIPTGGGKTEAYLAIMAFAMALRRRKALSNRDGSNCRNGGGTSVISRYTLRLLTVQQFRRTVQMVTAAEYLRTRAANGFVGWRPDKCENRENFIFGSVRFSAGLWVGGSVTPNALIGKHGALSALTGNNKDSEPAQLTTCPACGAWLSIPTGGIPEGIQKLHLVLESNNDPIFLKNFILKFVYKNEKLEAKGIDVTEKDHAEGFVTSTFLLTCSSKINEDDIENLWSIILKKANESDLDLKIASYRASRQGYFPMMEPSKNQARHGDFEMYCPNPSCHLNKSDRWIEGVPLNIKYDDKEILPDGLYIRKVKTPFGEGKRIPIPAFTVDEQIYRRCPTIVIATADKMARLAFEPRIASIFGNIQEYNACYGYMREDLLPKSTTKMCIKQGSSVQVTPFSPPDLIVQDELHLIDGPLGSMFGLYETIVDALCSNSGRVPKIIASTATIKHAESQIKALFARELFQFPPHGIDFDDSFFIHYPSAEQAWNEKRPGRIYAGLCAPGRGSHTPLIRIWSQLLKTGNDMKSLEHIENFWTIIGYFNAIRELGGALALYKQDIAERLEKISAGSDIRDIDPLRVMELSSRVESTKLPSILKELEVVKTPVNKNPDAIFATSMFGTGVDIPHISLMVVHGQPKTTSAYIQATGRVGRKYGALIVTFLRASRPRDMSHYEMFVNYHDKIYKDVEPVSASPFSDGALSKGLGPALISYLRNMKDPHVKWWDDNYGNVVLASDSEPDIISAIKIFVCRIKNFPDSVKQGKTEHDIEKNAIRKLDKWKYVAGQRDVSLAFNEYIMYDDPKKDVVLGDPAHKHAEKKIVYCNAPQSLRDVEETTGFQV